MNFKDNYFDVIICCHLLERIKDDRKVMHELFGVLKQKGIVILQIPISKTVDGLFI